MRAHRLAGLIGGLGVVAAWSGNLHALGTAFTYQGQLQQNGSPRNGPCDFQLILFDAVTGGTPVGTTQTVANVTVTGGLFTVPLDFGPGVFTGADRFLQIAVRCPAGSGTFTTLAPRQPLTATPYALYTPAAASAGDLACSGCVDAGALAAGAVTGAAIANGTIAAGKLAFTPGTVTAITAGAGLSGGTITTSGTIANTGVLSVAASAPLASSGGQNPSLSLSGVVGVGNGGTGASTAAAARGNLGSAASGANADITALSGITGDIALPNSGNANTGVILKGGVPFLHNFVGGTFLGANAGNFSSTGCNECDNTAVGGGALHSFISTDGGGGEDNTAVGSSALTKDTSGDSNTAVGVSALLENTTGKDNTAIGVLALGAHTVGNSNTAVGKLALFGTNGSASTATGSFNTALGASALMNNSTADNNTAVGYEALSSNTTGTENTALGQAALVNNVTGNDNTAVGRAALLSGVGDRNTVIGADAALQSTGSNNVALGYSAGFFLTSGHDNVDIANVGVAGESSTIRIGTTGTQSSTFIAGIYGAGVNSGYVGVVVDSTGHLGVGLSSERFKEHIEDMGDSTDGLMKLRPVQFRYRKDLDGSGLEQYGLVAEEVAKVYPDLVAYDDQGQPLSVRYHFVNAMLLNEVQKQARQIGGQKVEISEQRQEIADLKRRLVAQAGQVDTLTARLTHVEAVLDTHACGASVTDAGPSAWNGHPCGSDGRRRCQHRHT